MITFFEVTDNANFYLFSFQRLLNRLNLQSEDFVTACFAQATKGEKPVFAKL